MACGVSWTPFRSTASEGTHIEVVKVGELGWFIRQLTCVRQALRVPCDLIEDVTRPGVAESLVAGFSGG